LLRVASFRQAMLITDVLHDSSGRIAIEEGVPGRMAVEDLEIASPAGCTMLRERRVDIGGGERVAVLGESGIGKTLLFRALAGLWPWGGGRIVRPRGEEVSYVPRRPYLPPGTLREVLAYPKKVDSFAPDAFAAVLTRLGLQRLVPDLDVQRRWDRELSDDDQQGLMFARVLLQAPLWVLIDEVLDTVDQDTRARALDVFANELKRSTVIHIGRRDGSDPVFTRVLHLIKDPGARRMVRPRTVAAVQPT
jgi:putative ATP-binding cassette transporter